MNGNVSSVLVFFVNGKKVVEDQVNPEWTLLYYLRSKLQLCGTKFGCGDGNCGACTVMISKYDKKRDKIHHLAINACLAPVCSMHGLAVTTVEGIGSTKTKLHPVQERIAKSHGTQCGFCTPGIVMSMYALLRNSPKPSLKDLEVAFEGNLCRCTGYRPIIEGYKTFCNDAELMQNGCGMGDKCCKLQNGHKENDEEEVLFKPSEFTPYDSSQEPIFPPELKLYDTLDRQGLIFKGKEVTWYRPTQLQELLELKQKFPQAKLVVGNTEVGVDVKCKHLAYPVLINPVLIPELTNIVATAEGVKIGASVTLQELEKLLRTEIESQPEHKTRIFKAVVEMLRWFGNKQVRNVAAVGGNLMTASPVSDLNPIFLAARVKLQLESKAGKRTVTMDEHFFTGYHKSVVRNDEVLIAITIPYTSERQYFVAYKQAKRKDDDITIVNAAVDVTFGPDEKIDKINLAFGGMAPTTVTAPQTCISLIGKPWNEDTLNLALDALVGELPLEADAPGGMTQYRRALTLSFFFKAFLTVSRSLRGVDKCEVSATDEFEAGVLKSSQYFELRSTKEKLDTIGQPLPHLSAFKHATGEAIYCDDMPRFTNELYLGLVLSTKSHAKIVSIDASEALKAEGVHAVYSAKDLSPERNRMGQSTGYDYVFFEEVTSQGQIVAVVIAEDQLTAQKAARKVNVTYSELPSVITIKDAIEKKSYFKEIPPKILENGNVDEVFAKASHVVEGEVKTGTQEHFYIEPQSCIVVPKIEDEEVDVYCSTQFPSCITSYVAYALGVPENRIVTKVRRIGGGFGGKETQSARIAVPAAIAATRLGRPIRCMLDRDEDIMLTGSRHPLYIKYKTAFDDEGRILACEVNFYNNAGFSPELSEMNIERVLMHFQNAYKITNVRLKGYVCKTNLPCNMAMRGFGAPQGMLTGEFMIRKIAEYLNKDTVDVMRLNLYNEGDLTHYNQKLERCTIRRCWEECIASSDFQERKKGVEEYNAKNRWKKRGIGLVPTQYGCAFPVAFLNQAGALLHVYVDGSVMLSHGGTEMGQGLHTKMIQVASRVLGLPASKIHISETATDKVPNASPSAASFSSDINGPAVINACEIINERLEPYKQADPKGSWESWIRAAYLDRVSLSTTGFFKLPFQGYDWKTNTGEPHHYFTNGVACSEVEIDCLTGDHRVLRTDIVMDIGESMNPAIDIGQIEGAFMQGYGMYMLEELVYSPDGTILSRGPGNYKLPSFASIPLEFNVSLLKGAPNPRAVYSSKAVGEPPLFLASSVLFAVREAIKAARKDAELPMDDFTVQAPMTAERIRMACEDRFTAKLGKLEPGTYVPWNVEPTI